jgi:hypothetical protein
VENSKTIKYKDWEMIVECYWEPADHSVGLEASVMPQKFTIVGQEDNEVLSDFIWDRYDNDYAFECAIDKLLWEA